MQYSNIKKLLVIGSLYLAGKFEEENVRLRDLINVCYSTLYKNNPPLEIADLYWNLRKSVNSTEIVIMRALSFKFCRNDVHKVC